MLEPVKSLVSGAQFCRLSLQGTNPRGPRGYTQTAMRTDGKEHPGRLRLASRLLDKAQAGRTHTTTLSDEE